MARYLAHIYLIENIFKKSNCDDNFLNNFYKYRYVNKSGYSKKNLKNLNRFSKFRKSKKDLNFFFLIIIAI
jgi:hypothetical protein